LALYPFQYETPTEKTNSIDWLLEVQDKNGCWHGSILDTAFILYSVWPKETTASGFDLDCATEGYYCMSEIDCDGSVLAEYNCAGVSKCCSLPRQLDSCVVQAGEVCDVDENCAGGITTDASGLVYGESCCVGGVCQTASSTIADCEVNEGTCKTQCSDGEEESFTYTCDYGDSCCVQTTGGTNWTLWILLILIALVGVGILFKDSLRPYYLQITSMFGGRGSASSSPTPRPPFSPPSRPSPRRMIHAPRTRPMMHRPQPRGELDEVLKKLKEMGK